MREGIALSDFSGVLTTIPNAAKQENGDYNQDGLLHCGKCRTAKQTYVELPLPEGGKRRMIRSCLCRCEQEAQERERTRLEGERFQAALQQMRAEDHFTDPTFLGLTFDRDDGERPALSALCRRYIAHWERMRTENLGLLFYGPVGTGKSFYACCIANELARCGFTTTVTNLPRLLNLLQSTREKQTLIDRLQRYQLLVLDDLGVERDSSYAAEQVFNIIDTRSRSGLPLIVTTNLTLEELRNPGSMQYARIYDRVLDMCPVHQLMAGESRRIKHAEQRNQLARTILLG